MYAVCLCNNKCIYINMHININIYISICELNMCILMSYNANALLLDHSCLPVTFHYSKSEKSGSHHVPFIYLIIISSIHVQWFQNC